VRASIPVLYRLGRWLLRAALGFYFARIERFHRERVPPTGPVLFVSNHPNSITDAFIIAVSVPQKVNFVATVQLFRLAPIRWLLTRCGVIPVNRVRDDPRAMRTVRDTFDACFGALEKGEAVGLFPEGITHDDPQLKTVKSGAARMAIELEHRHTGKLGLRIAPAGLTFSAKERFRSEVLVHFGEPILAADFLADYPEKKHACIHALSQAIQHRIEELMLHLPTLERARIVDAVRRLYLDRLLVGNRVIHEPVPPRAGELMLTQAIARAVEFTCEHHPERAARFAQRLDRYEGWLKRLNLSDAELARLPAAAWRVWHGLGWTLLGVALFPVALFGWLHRLLPLLVVRRAIRQFAQPSANKTRISTIAILAGLISFGVIYGAFVILFHAFFGLPASFWYALSLPAASLLTHYYLRSLVRIALGARSLWVIFHAPIAARRLRAMREALIAEIEAARWQVPADALTRQPKGE